MLAVRLLLAIVLLISGLTKAVAPRRTASAARDLGVLAALGPVTAVLLPSAELAVAVLLAITPTVTAGAVAATALMTAFTLLVAGNLIRGRRPACACFGALSAEQPIGPAALTRNLVLLAAAATVLGFALRPGGACHTGCYDAAGARELAVAGGLVVLAAVAVGLAMIHTLTTTVGRLAARVRDLEAALGRAPSGPGTDLAALHQAIRSVPVTRPAGPATSLADAVGGAPETLLLLMSARCGACERLRDRIRSVPPPRGLRVVGVIDRLPADHRTDPDDPLTMVADGGRIATAAGVQAFPSGVLLDDGWRPIGDLLTGATALRRLLDERAAAPVRTDIAEPEPVPSSRDAGVELHV